MNKRNLHLTLGLQIRSIKFFFFAILLSLPFAGKASHIVGGEINYTCLGGDQYEVTLTVYRDCFYGLAPFDDPAAVGIFSETGFLVDTLMLPLLSIDTLDAILSDTCLFVPNDVCVSTTTYRRVVTLPLITGGYTLAYQRCCRNQTVNNIVSPDNTGATFTVEITEKALTECNSNAKFEAWPPIFICVNEPIFFSQAAIDTESDSVVYRICTPYAAGDSTHNRPQPPLAPPYDTIVWVSSNFNINNPLGFGEPLKINSETGMLTGTPTMKGQYVVGICVEEYRDGELLSVTRRDFQYNVGDCGTSESSFTIPEVQCEDLTVNFENNSENTTNFIWQFNDPANPDASSTETNPTYTYADTGRYTIRLITEPGNSCRDTSFQEIYLKNSSLTSNFSFTTLGCDPDSISLQFNDNSVDTYSTITNWFWELSDGQSSTAQNPIFTITASESVTVKLTASSDDGCDEIYEEAIDMNFSDLPPFDIPADTTVCGSAFQLMAGDIPSVNYAWSIDRNFEIIVSNLGLITITPEGTKTYYIRAINSLGCERIDSVNVSGNIIDVSFPNLEYLCLDEESNITINNNDTNDNLSYSWSPLTDIISGATTASPIFKPSSIGSRSVSVRITDEFGCTVDNDFDYQILDASPLSEFTAQQACEGFTYSFQNTGNNTEFYTWDFGDGSANVPGQTINHTYAAPGKYTVRLIPDAALPCSLSLFEKEIEVFENLRTPDFDWQYNFCQNDAIIAFTNLSSNNQGEIIGYKWKFSNGLSSNQTNPTILVATSQALDVELTMSTSDGCTQTMNRTIDVDVVDLNIPSSILNCDGSSTILNEGGNLAYSYVWSPSESLDNPAIASPTANPSSNTTYTVTITNGSCEITRSIDLLVSNVTTTELSDSIVICNGDGVAINSGVLDNPNFQYSWTPVEGLSDPTAANPIASPSTTTIYTVSIQDMTNNCEVSRLIKAVIPVTPLTADIGFDYIECLDSAVIQLKDLSQNSNGDIISWDWQLSNGMSFDEESPIVNLQNLETIGVTLTVNTNVGCSDTKTEQLDLNLLDLTLPDTVLVCIGGATELNPGADPSLQYQWFPINNLDNGTAANPLASPIKTTEYFVTITRGAPQCQIKRTILAQVPTYTTNLDFDWEYETCSDSSVVLFVDQSNNTEFPIIGWDWSFGNGLLSNTESTSVTIDSAQTLSVDLKVTTEDGCEHQLPTQEIEIDVIDFNPIDSLQTCFNEPITLNEKSNPSYNYGWSADESLSDTTARTPTASPTVNTIYTVTASIETEKGTCSAERNISVIVPSPIEFSLNVQDSVICEAEILLEANIISGEFIQWSSDNEFTQALSNAATLLTEPEKVSVYYVAVADEFGCVLIDSVSISSNALNYELDSEHQICLGDTAFLSVVNLNAEEVLNFVWSPDSEIAKGQGEATVAVTPNDDVQYLVAIENQFGCMATDTVEVEIVDLTTDISISAEPDTIGFRETSQLKVTNLRGFSYTWVPTNTLNDFSIFNPIASPEETTTYAVIVENDEGCIGRKVITVTVNDLLCDEPFIFVPKAFTPNGDGKNDVVFVRGNPIDKMFFAIYNRWGEKVFETEEQDFGWDGRYNGKLLNPDVYGYFLRVVCNGGEEYFKKGNITLIR